MKDFVEAKPLELELIIKPSEFYRAMAHHCTTAESDIVVDQFFISVNVLTINA
jgi:hypothetical protein